MSGITWTFTTTEIALAPATEKTGLQVITPTSHHRIKISGWGVYFDAASVEAGPGQVMFNRQSTIGTMTGLTAVKGNTSDRETIQTSAAFNATAEPTNVNVLKRVEVHPQTGYEYVYPFGKELQVPGGEKIGISALFPNSVNCVFFVEGEERQRYRNPFNSVVGFETRRRR